MIEANRINLFDIVTHYRAIFPDDEPVTAYRMRYAVGAAETGGPGAQRDLCTAAILASWLNHKVARVMESLAADLDRCVNNEFGHHYPIESLAEPVSYFGLSMSRVGADLRPQLTVLINESISRNESCKSGGGKKTRRQEDAK